MRIATLVAATLAALSFTGSCATPRPVETGGVSASVDRVVLDAARRDGPRVLAVTAHPDDDSGFAATLFKTATHLDGACDIVVITNGEGGFKYATLAESWYGRALTEESTGRAHLPAVRREEMLAGARLMHVRSVTFLGEQDHRYTQDPSEVLDDDAGVWDLERVRTILARTLTAGRYDFVLTLAPTAETHGHHQAATLLALEAVARLPVQERPAVLAARVVDDENAAERDGHFTQRDTFPLTRTRQGSAPFRFDRTAPFGFRERLDYRVLVNLVIAQHRSQGTMQLAMNRGTHEVFTLFDVSPPGSEQRVAAWFERLAEPQFVAREYGPSAGTNATVEARE